MPTPTVDEFWNLLARSRLVDAGVVEELRTAQLLAGGGADVQAAAQWLVDRGAVSRWQAKRLANGDLGPFFLGDYRLLERHERHGDGLLFSARHDPSGRHVTLMLLNAKRCRDLEVWTAIVTRTTAAHRATGPMLSRTWALEQAEGSRFIVCETVVGVPLADELARLGPLPPAQAGVLALQVARAVAEIHAAGGVHGGLSLDALLREPAPPGAPERNGRIRLLQFPLVGDPHVVPLRPGVTTDAELARLGRRASFVAPELLLPDRACDARSDVYAIGCILHALITGTPPCWQGHPQATLRQAAFAGPTPLGPTVAAELSAVAACLTARDPDARYQSAGDAADAIALALGIVERSAKADRPGGSAVMRPADPGDGVATAAAVTPSVADFDWRPQATGVAPMPKRPGPAMQAGGSPATRAARRRAARLRFIGAGIAAAILVAAVAIVVSRIDFMPRLEPSADGGPDGEDAVVPRADEQPASPAVQETPSASSPVSPAPAAAVAPEPAVAAVRQIVIDDASLPWASPTAGPPPRLAFLPPEAELVLLVRPAAALAAADEEGTLFLKALGPAAESAARELTGRCGCDLADIEWLQIGWQVGGVDEVLEGYAIRLIESRRIPADEAARQAAWGATTAKVVDGATIHEGKSLAFWVPESDSGRTLVAAPKETLPQIIAAAATAPAEGLAASLPKEMETLVGMLDADRHLTIFGSPHHLLHDGRDLLVGPLARLADPLADLFGDATRAAALSLHFGDNAYAELDVIATADAPASRLAPAMAAAVAAAIEPVEQYCARLDPAPYGRRLVLRLPAMLRELNANLRAGVEGKAVVLNAYLPRHAPHNLALAAELALAQSPGAVAVGTRPAAAMEPQDALGRLQQKIELAFVKETLERAIQLVAEESGVPMEIIGSDLQLEGITKNQSFGLDEKDKPAVGVLRTILAKANPDGKLVFVVRTRDGRETIEITTRAAAAKRGDTLPAGQ